MKFNNPIRAQPQQGSPIFLWTNAATILPTITLSQSWENYNSGSTFYLPFNYTRITNNSLCEIIFYANQDGTQGVVIPAGSNVSIDADIIPALASFSIRNNDAANTIAIGQITLINSKVAVKA